MMSNFTLKKKSMRIQTIFVLFCVSDWQKAKRVVTSSVGKVLVSCGGSAKGGNQHHHKFTRTHRLAKIPLHSAVN